MNISVIGKYEVEAESGRENGILELEEICKWEEK
jgi:hypothetical protein